MRRYDIVFAILLIHSVVDFTLAVPVLVQEKRQTCVNVEHIPRDVITVLGKRGSEEMERLIKEFIGTWKTLVESSDAHASSSSAPPVPDHGSMNEVNAPAPNPAPSPANPNPLMDPLSPSTIVHSPVVKGDALSDSESDYGWLYDSHGEPIMPMASPTLTELGSDHELMEEHVPQPNTSPMPSTSEDQDFDSGWDYWTNLEDQPPPKRPKPESSKEFGQAHEGQVQQPNPGPSNPRPPDPGAWNPGPSNPRPPTGSRYGVVIAPSPNPGSAEELEYEAAQHEGPPSPELTDPELHFSDDQSSSADSQPVDPSAAALYAAKGKSKELRGIPDTTRDVGDAAQRELQLGEDIL